MTNANNIAAKLTELTDYITNTIERLEKGEVVNIAHLDGAVEEVCEQAMSLPRAQTEKIQEPMALMISKLEELGRALKDFKSHLKDHYDV